jgi:hypothetical protein
LKNKERKKSRQTVDEEKEEKIKTAWPNTFWKYSKINFFFLILFIFLLLRRKKKLKGDIERKEKK